MKLSILPVAAVALLLSGGAWAQTAADTLKDAATQAATQAATDGINKAVGTTANGGDTGKSKKSKQKDGPNWGKSEDHRQDGDNGHKGKSKNKKKDRD